MFPTSSIHFTSRRLSRRWENSLSCWTIVSVCAVCAHVFVSRFHTIATRTNASKNSNSEKWENTVSASEVKRWNRRGNHEIWRRSCMCWNAVADGMSNLHRRTRTYSSNAMAWTVSRALTSTAEDINNVEISFVSFVKCVFCFSSPLARSNVRSFVHFSSIAYVSDYIFHIGHDDRSAANSWSWYTHQTHTDTHETPIQCSDSDCWTRARASQLTTHHKTPERRCFSVSVGRSFAQWNSLNWVDGESSSFPPNTPQSFSYFFSFSIFILNSIFLLLFRSRWRIFGFEFIFVFAGEWQFEQKVTIVVEIV